MGPAVYLNSPNATHVRGQSIETASQVLAVHRKLPHYDETPLHALPGLARELRLGHVFVKDESCRFGLPSFKILGASWAVFRALAGKLGLDPARLVEEDTHEPSRLWGDLGARANSRGLALVTCSEGNWVRAVARMARYLDMPARVLVPAFMPETTRARIRSEGAEVTVVDGHYDDSVAAAKREAGVDDKAILVMDTGWDGYEQIPQWVVGGYSTMLRETDAQVLATTRGLTATHALVPVGVGSIAHAVARHYKSTERDQRARARVVAVEPTTAACLRASLEAGRIATVNTADSIMCGMNCGTVSSAAWPVLRSAVDADVTVTDHQAHAAVCELESLGLQPGPCGAATLAALRTACRDARAELSLSPSSVVVLFCTEAKREYKVRPLSPTEE